MIKNNISEFITKCYEEGMGVDCPLAIKDLDGNLYKKINAIKIILLQSEYFLCLIKHNGDEMRETKWIDPSAVCKVIDIMHGKRVEFDDWHDVCVVARCMDYFRLKTDIREMAKLISFEDVTDWNFFIDTLLVITGKENVCDMADDAMNIIVGASYFILRSPNLSITTKKSICSCFGKIGVSKHKQTLALACGNNIVESSAKYHGVDSVHIMRNFGIVLLHVNYCFVVCDFGLNELRRIGVHHLHKSKKMEIETHCFPFMWGSRLLIFDPIKIDLSEHMHFLIADDYSVIYQQKFIVVLLHEHNNRVVFRDLTKEKLKTFDIDSREINCFMCLDIMYYNTLRRLTDDLCCLSLFMYDTKTDIHTTIFITNEKIKHFVTMIGVYENEFFFHDGNRCFSFAYDSKLTKYVARHDFYYNYSRLIHIKSSGKTGENLFNKTMVSFDNIEHKIIMKPTTCLTFDDDY